MNDLCVSSSIFTFSVTQSEGVRGCRSFLSLGEWDSTVLCTFPSPPKDPKY